MAAHSSTDQQFQPRWGHVLYCAERADTPPSHQMQQPPIPQQDCLSPDTAYARNRHATRLFDGIAAGYDGLAELFSGFQYGRWRRFLVSRIAARAGDTIIDVCTGTAGIALASSRASGASVIGIDISPQMLERAHRKVLDSKTSNKVALALGRAENLPLSDNSVDVVCFSYLLRYVDEPAETIQELARVLRPGGQMVSLEFAVPDNTIARALWRFYTEWVMPPIALCLSPGWRYVGAFLGPSISNFYKSYPLERISEMWEEVGLINVQSKKLSFGGGVVMWGNKRG